MDGRYSVDVIESVPQLPGQRGRARTTSECHGVRRAWNFRRDERKPLLPAGDGAAVARCAGYGGGRFVTEMALSNEIELRVLSVVREVLALEGDGPSLDSTINADLGADSLDQLSLFMALEDEFGGKISEDDAAALVTLRDVVRYVHERMVAAGVG